MKALLRLLVVVTLVPAAMATAACHSAPRGGAPTPPATATPTPAPTSTQSPEAAVSAAYLAYWDAYSKAVLNLDASLVEGFAAGDELTSIRDEIEGHRRDGVAVRIAVQHDFAVVQVSPTAATVIDQVINRSFFVDPTTKEPQTSNTPGNALRYTFFLQRTGDRWIVVRGLKETPS